MPLDRRMLLKSGLALLTAPAVSRFGRADAAQFTLKLHHSFSSVSSVHDRFLAPWARQVELQSGARIRIDLFPSMQLGGAPAGLLDQARDGVAEIVWAEPSRTPGRYPKIEAFELPFVPSRRALVSSKALQAYGEANLQDEFRDVHALCFSCSDAGVLHTNRPIRIAEEIRGLRLQVRTGFAAEALRALGAFGIVMPSGQLAFAVSRHVVEGALVPWHMAPGIKLSDVLKSHTEFSDSSLSTTTFVLAMNRTAYERLPGDLKKVLDNNSGQSAAAMAGTMWDLQAAAIADQVAQRGEVLITLLPEAVGHWRKATEPVIEAWLKNTKERRLDGGKLLAAVRALLARYADEPEPQPPQISRQAASSEIGQRPGAASDPGSQAKPPASSPAAPAPASAAQAAASAPTAPIGSAAPAARPAPTPSTAAAPAPASPPATSTAKPLPIKPLPKALDIPL